MRKLFLSAGIVALTATQAFAIEQPTSKILSLSQTPNHPMNPQNDQLKFEKQTLKDQVARLKEENKNNKAKIVQLRAIKKNKQAERAAARAAKTEELIQTAEKSMDTSSKVTPEDIANVNAAQMSEATTKVLATMGVDEQQQQEAEKTAQEGEKVANDVKANPQEAEQLALKSNAIAADALKDATQTIKEETQPVLEFNATDSKEVIALTNASPEDVKKEDVKAVVETAKENITTALETPKGDEKNNPDLAKLKKMAEKLLAIITALQNSDKPEDKAKVTASAVALAPVTDAMATVVNGSDNVKEEMQKAANATDIAEKAVVPKTSEEAAPPAPPAPPMPTNIPSAPPVPSSPGKSGTEMPSDLQSEIKAGVTLKKTEITPQDPKPTDGNNLKDVLKNSPIFKSFEEQRKQEENSKDEQDTQDWE
jgi:hypothetical protein